MFMQGYFYWSGVVINVVAVFWVIVACCMTVKQWHEERKIKRKYAKKEVGGK